MNQTQKRLSIINLAISITDIETIQLQILKLGLLKTDTKIQEIIAVLQAENYAKAQFMVKTFTMVVLSDRSELISYYERRGYNKRGVSKEFPTHLNVGQPKKSGLTIQSLLKNVYNRTAEYIPKLVVTTLFSVRLMAHDIISSGDLSFNSLFQYSISISSLIIFLNLKYHYPIGLLDLNAKIY